jgi:hypothetical protein
VHCHDLDELLAWLFSLGFVVRKAQLEGVGHPFQPQSLIWIDLIGFFRGSLMETITGRKTLQESAAELEQNAGSTLQVSHLTRDCESLCNNSRPLFGREIRIIL